jgi:hypothetical protein
LVVDRLAGDVGTIAAAAERGDAQAQLHMLCQSVVNDRFDEYKKWARRVYAHVDNTDAIRWIG